MNKEGLNKLLKKLETIPNQEKMCNKPHHRSNKYTFYISKEHDDFLETFAKKYNTSKTSLIEYAIDLFLESYGRLFDK